MWGTPNGQRIPLEFIDHLGSPEYQTFFHTLHLSHTVPTSPEKGPGIGPKILDGCMYLGENQVNLAGV